MASTHQVTTTRSAPESKVVPSGGWASHLSVRSWLVLGAGVTASLGVFLAQVLFVRSGSAFAATAFSDIGEAVVVGWSAVVILWLASRLSADGVLRDQWLLIGASTAAFFIGDAIWAWYEIGMRARPPYPGFADVFYAASYLLFAVAVMYAAVTYAHGVNLRLPTWLAAGTGVLLTMAAFPLAVGPIISAAGPVAGQATSIAYIFADIWLQIVPALLIVLVIQRTGRQAVAWAWIAVAVAAGVMGLSDSVFGIMTAQGLYAPGSLADLGWMIGHVLLAVAASMAVDAHSADTLLPEAGIGG
jgi:hypothetical protein